MAPSLPWSCLLAVVGGPQLLWLSRDSQVSFHRSVAYRTVAPCTTSGARSPSAFFTLPWLASGVPDHPFMLLPERSTWLITPWTSSTLRSTFLIDSAINDSIFLWHCSVLYNTYLTLFSVKILLYVSCIIYYCVSNKFHMFIVYACSAIWLVQSVDRESLILQKIASHNLLMKFAKLHISSSSAKM